MQNQSFDGIRRQFSQRASPLLRRLRGPRQQGARPGTSPDSTNPNPSSPRGDGPPQVSVDNPSSGTNSPSHGSDYPESTQHGTPDSRSGENQPSELPRDEDQKSSTFSSSNDQSSRGQGFVERSTDPSKSSSEDGLGDDPPVDNSGSTQSNETQEASAISETLKAFANNIIEKIDSKLDKSISTSVATQASIQSVSEKLDDHKTDTRERFTRLEIGQNTFQRDMEKRIAEQEAVQTHLNNKLESVISGGNVGSGTGNPSLDLGDLPDLLSAHFSSISKSGSGGEDIDVDFSKLNEAELQIELDKASAASSSTYFNHDSNTKDPNHFKRSKALENHKGQKISLVKNGTLVLNSSEVRRMQRLVEDRVGTFGLKEQSMVDGVDILQMNSKISVARARQHISKRYDEAVAQDIDVSDGLSKEDRVRNARRRATNRTHCKSVATFMESMFDSQTFSYFRDTFRSEIIFSFKDVEFLDPFMLMAVINRSISPLASEVTKSIREEARRITASNYKDHSCIAAAASLSKLKEQADKIDCDIKDQEWRDHLFTAVTSCGVPAMHSKMVDLKLDEEMKLQEGKPRLSYHDLVLRIQTIELTLKGCDDWKPPSKSVPSQVKTKATFAQAAKSSVKDDKDKKQSSKSNSKSKKEDTTSSSNDKSWISVPPSDGFVTKVVHGTNYYWHSTCKAWRKWKVKDCNKCKKLSNDTSTSSSSNSEQKRVEREKGVRLEASKVALNALEAGDAQAFFNEFSHLDPSDFR